jgi:hypothetical protein
MKAVRREDYHCVGAGTPQQLRAFLSVEFFLGWVVQGLLFLGGRVDHKVHHPVAVAKFIVIPGNELDKMVIEGNANPSIKGGRVGVSVKVLVKVAGP